MWIKNIFLLFFGLCSGGIIAAGVYAFLAIIGVFVRLIGKTKTKKNIMLYENMIIIMELYKVRLPLGEVFGQIFLLTGGVSVGIFTGCLAMSLAETLKALPTFSRRIRLSVGLPWLIIAIAAGKCGGSLLYFWRRMAAGKM